MDITKVRSDRPASTEAAGSSAQSRATKSVQEAATSETKKTGALEKPSFEPKQFEKVTLSPDSLVVTEGVQMAKDAPDVRADRVAELKAAIKGGTYKVDAKAVADRMIQSSLEESILTRGN